MHVIKGEMHLKNAGRIYWNSCMEAQQHQKRQIAKYFVLIHEKSRSIIITNRGRAMSIVRRLPEQLVK